jgi:hypothetical protein
VRSRNQAAKRRALSRYPLNRAKYLLYAGARAAKQTAAANARLNKVVHMSRSYAFRGSATDLSATGLLRIVADASRNRVYPISAALGAQVG